MDINFFKKKLSYCISNNKKIIILGRGFSTSLFLKKYKKVKDGNIIIGFNTNEITDKIDFYLLGQSMDSCRGFLVYNLIMFLFLIDR